MTGQATDYLERVYAPCAGGFNTNPKQGPINKVIEQAEEHREEHPLHLPSVNSSKTPQRELCEWVSPYIVHGQEMTDKQKLQETVQESGKAALCWHGGRCDVLLNTKET